MERQLGKGAVEKWHIKNVDILVNKLALNQMGAGVVRNMIIEELESGDEPFATWIVSERYSRVKLDRLINTRFVVKQKWIGPASATWPDLQRLLELEIPNDDEFEDKRAIQASNSIFNEMLNSVKIRQIINTDETQQTVQRYGFSGIIFVEPLIGVIARQAQMKYICYEYIDYQLDLIDYYLGSNYEVRDALIKELQAIFIKAGILPNDLTAKQILVAGQGKGNLFLIDTEAMVAENGRGMSCVWK